MTIVIDISIHAPHARSDEIVGTRGHHFILFQSTLLMRGATEAAKKMLEAINYFNPRSSCEERHGGVAFKTANRIFQSTLLMRGATPR